MNRMMRRRQAKHAKPGTPMTVAQMDAQITTFEHDLTGMEAAVVQLRTAIAGLKTVRDALAAVQGVEAGT
jgi:hypothetical protein